MITIGELISKTNALDLHNIGLTGRGVRVAVLDSGIDIYHEVFSNTKITSYQIAEGNLYDSFGHGTHVSSILVGIAPNIDLYNIKILDDNGLTSISQIMKGINIAMDYGVDVINISAGKLIEECPDGNPLSILIEKALEKGILIVCSAGNMGPRVSPHIPAACRGSVSVGSINDRGKTNKFSSRGPVCEDSYPDCVSYGDDILAASPNNEYVELSGSSQAAPQVSGMFALVKQAFKNKFNREDIEILLEDSCNRIESSNKNNYSGWGAIDMLKFYRATELYVGNYDISFYDPQALLCRKV